MVSFWPFGRRDENSPDSFERILAKLSTRIQERNTHLAKLHTQARRYKALWTIYTIIAWIFYIIVLALVVGKQGLTLLEIGGAVGGPIVIYTGRRAFVAVFEYRINKADTALAALVAERDETIEKLKTATKFYSTQSLLEKYGGGSEMTEDTRIMSRKGSMAGIDAQQQQQQQLRQRQIASGSLRGKPQHLQPSPPPPVPPLPNLETLEPLTPQQMQVQEQLRQQQNLRPLSVPGHQIHSAQGSPTRGTFSAEQSPQPQPQPSHVGQPPVTFATTAQFIEPETQSSGGSWYDRLLDVLIGEDETSSKARFALICTNCRMVNGLAPPGTKSMAEVGKWGCARCGAMNGKDVPRGKKDAVLGVKEQIEREIAEEMLANSVKRGGGRSRGSIRGWTKQIMAAQQEEQENEDEEGPRGKGGNNNNNRNQNQGSGSGSEDEPGHGGKK
ncbi:hypothetical protein DFH27DRAFT_566572 [Peziza echinospora]|nr:hypothetical protein DFH27DRAFT_566572 [Peziza echinospora]